MSAGLYTIGVIAEFLGKRPEDMPALIETDGLPVIKVPTETKSIRKVALMSLHRWLTAKSENDPLTVDDLEKELDRCSAAIAARLKEKREREAGLESATKLPTKKKTKISTLQLTH